MSSCGAAPSSIFALLHEDRWEVLNTPRLLTRTQAAHLLIDMFPAAERSQLCSCRSLLGPR